MGTFTIDLLTGNQYLFNGDFSGSGGTSTSGVTTAQNGLCINGQTVKLGGVLCCATTLTAINGTSLSFVDLRTTKIGIQYGGNYSTDFTDRSLVDKGYVDNKVSGSTPTWNTLTNRPAWLTGTTLSAFQLGHKHSQYLTGVTWIMISGKPSFNYLPLSGGTLIGAVSGTSLRLNGTITLADAYGKTGTISEWSNNVGNGLINIQAGGTNSIVLNVSDGFNNVFGVSTSNQTSFFRDKLKVGDWGGTCSLSADEVLGVYTGALSIHNGLKITGLTNGILQHV